MATTISRILVPIDFSACSQAALLDAVMFAEQFQAEIEALHVWEVPHSVRPDLMVWMEGSDRQRVGDVVEAQAQADMEAFLQKLAPEGRAKLKTRVEGGEPVEVILERAKKGEFDLLVLGTHGRTGVQHLIMGSVAEKVVRRASCPVLTVRVHE